MEMKPPLKIQTVAADNFPLDHGQLQQVLTDEIAALSEWIDGNAPYCEQEDGQLREGSRERAYWHHGYRAALRDTLTMLKKHEE